MLVQKNKQKEFTTRTASANIEEATRKDRSESTCEHAQHYPNHDATRIQSSRFINHEMLHPSVNELVYADYFESGWVSGGWGLEMNVMVPNSQGHSEWRTDTRGAGHRAEWLGGHT